MLSISPLTSNKRLLISIKLSLKALYLKSHRLNSSSRSMIASVHKLLSTNDYNLSFVVYNKRLVRSKQRMDRSNRWMHPSIAWVHPLHGSDHALGPTTKSGVRQRTRVRWSGLQTPSSLPFFTRLVRFLKLALPTKRSALKCHLL